MGADPQMDVVFGSGRVWLMSRNQACIAIAARMQPAASSNSSIRPSPRLLCSRPE